MDAGIESLGEPNSLGACLTSKVARPEPTDPVALSSASPLLFVDLAIRRASNFEMN